MANYSIVANMSNAFKPFTYDELTKPLVAYRQEEDRRQKAYLDMQEKAASLDDLNGYDQDAKYYGIYQDYRQQLDNVVEDMMHNGLTQANNRAFQLYNTYNQKILPIKNLMDKRNELIQEQRKLGQDADNMFTVNYANASLDDVRANKGMYRTINGKTLYQMGKELAASASSRKEGIGKLNTKDKNTLAAQYFYIRKGYGADAAQNFLKNNANIPELADAIQRIQQSAGTSQLQNSFDQQRANDYIINGIMAGLTQESKTIDNKNFESDETAERLRLAKDAQDLQSRELNWRMSKPDVVQGADGNFYEIGNTVDSNGRVTGTTITKKQGVIPKNSKSDATVVDTSTPEGKVAAARNRLTALQLLQQTPRYGRRPIGGSFEFTDNNAPSGYSESGLTGGAKVIPLSDLGKDSQRTIRDWLSSMNLTEKDIIIKADTDWWNDNHYRIEVNPKALQEAQQDYNNSINPNPAQVKPQQQVQDEVLDFGSD